MNMMKRIGAGVALALLWAAAAVIVGTHSGCATVQKHSAAAGIVVQFATLKYIEQAPPDLRAGRAARVIVVAAAVDSAVGDTGVTVERLAALAIERIPADLAPSDRILAIGLVNLVAEELTARIGSGGIEPGSVVTLRGVLAQVRQAAEVYAPRDRKSVV